MIPAPRSLAGRLVAATVLVALVVAGVTALAAWQLVRDVAQDQARAELERQATTLASSPRLRRQLERREQVLLGAGATSAAYVGADGAVRTGSPEAPEVTDEVVDDLLAGRPVSRTVRSGGTTVLVEGRPTRAGGGVVVQLPLAAVDDSSRDLLARVLLAVVVGLVAAIAVGVVLARRVARPLARTAGEAGRLAAGERGVVVEPSGLGEVDAVGQALATLDAALVRSEGRQREFLLSVSHEMRTPLTAVQGLADALADGLVGPTEVAPTARTLGEETRRLDRFVEDLLLLARLEADDFTLDPQPVDVALLVHEAGRAWGGEARRCEVGLRVEGAPSLPARLDPQRARQLVDGLVENALRATPAGGSVTIGAGSDDVRVRITVADTGPGLTADDLTRALDRGALHRRYRGSRPVGTGLGLSVAARLAERMGGRVAPVEVDRGARFVVDLPRGRGPAAEH